MYKCSFCPHTISLMNGKTREGCLIRLEDESGNEAWGECSPLSPLNKETAQDCFRQLADQHQNITQIHWTQENIFQELRDLNLFPSVAFALESALLSLLCPISIGQVTTSALLMGSVEEILSQAQERKKEGYHSAKVKVSSLSCKEAFALLEQLKEQFHLRVDVNCAWKTEESLQFFSQFPLDSFEYIEEPFQNPLDLTMFPHPFAIDESFLNPLSLEQLEALPNLKALIYKPTAQGGLAYALPLYHWTQQRGLLFVLSSCFESELGCQQVADMAHRLGLKNPVGLGTHHFLKEKTFKSSAAWELGKIERASFSNKSTS